jgi:hypothetical protein
VSDGSDEFVNKAIASAVVLCAQVAFADADFSAASTPAPDKSQYTLFDPTPVNLRGPYNTDRPSKTDSPYTVDAGVFQIESDVANWTLDYEYGVRTRTWIIGNSNFKLGLTSWMELQVFPQFYVNTRTSGPSFGKPVEHDGFGDTTVRLKFNLLGNDGGKLVMGFVSFLKDSDKYRRHGQPRLGTRIWLARELLLTVGFYIVRPDQDRYPRSTSKQRHAGAVAKSDWPFAHDHWKVKRLHRIL